MSQQLKIPFFFALFFTLLAVTAHVSVNRLEHHTRVALAKQTSSVLVTTMNIMRESYSEEVVDKVRLESRLSIGPGHEKVENRIPNPATFAIELGEKVSDFEKGLIIRLYSHFPFPNREKTGGPQDAFETEALAYLEKNPQDSFVRQEKVNGIETIRYAEAIPMKKSCVDCHNNHPASPKKDWKVGEVRGVLEVTQPLLKGDGTLKTMIHSAYIAFFCLALISVTSLLFTLSRVNVLSKRVAFTSEKAKTLDSIAHTDELTGIANRRAFEAEINALVARGGGSDEPLAIIIFDIDHFKQINDRYGHAMGDKCLLMVSQAASRILRVPKDFFARYGGDEFVAILPDTQAKHAVRVAERIRHALSSLGMGVEGFKLTASMGIAAGFPKTRSDFDELLKKADLALYHAKDQGRNRTIVHNNLELGQG